jgi:hypothetical protein
VPSVGPFSTRFGSRELRSGVGSDVTVTRWPAAVLADCIHPVLLASRGVRVARRRHPVGRARNPAVRDDAVGGTRGQRDQSERIWNKRTVPVGRRRGRRGNSAPCRCDGPGRVLRACAQRTQ